MAANPGFPPEGGKVRCHNTEAMKDLLDAVDWSPAGTGYPRAPAVVVKRSVDDKRARAEKSREAFMEKQSVREKEFLMKFEVAKKEAERRLKEKAATKEREFEERFKAFQERNSELIRSVDGAIAAGSVANAKARAFVQRVEREGFSADAGSDQRPTRFHFRLRGRRTAPCDVSKLSR